MDDVRPETTYKRQKSEEKTRVVSAAHTERADRDSCPGHLLRNSARLHEDADVGVHIVSSDALHKSLDMTLDAPEPTVSDYIQNAQRQRSRSRTEVMNRFMRSWIRFQ
jgi:flagella basal body P-ring formation protein FlgA